MLNMLDNTGDWCFEGGCTYAANTDLIEVKNADTAALEARYEEPCIASYD